MVMVNALTHYREMGIPNYYARMLVRLTQIFRVAPFDFPEDIVYLLAYRITGRVRYTEHDPRAGAIELAHVCTLHSGSHSA